MKRQYQWACGIVVGSILVAGLAWLVYTAANNARNNACELQKPKQFVGGFIWSSSGMFASGEAQFYFTYVGKRSITGGACDYRIRVPEAVYIKRMFGRTIP